MIAPVLLADFFSIESGDFHAVSELAPGPVPLISCGGISNGLVGYYDVAPSMCRENALTVAYNGSWPLTAHFHPYRFAAKDDVAVLSPLNPDLDEKVLLYFAAALNRMTWRYSYGRKCFKKKLSLLSVPVHVLDDSPEDLDLDTICSLVPDDWMERLVPHYSLSPLPAPHQWALRPITDFFSVSRGDFHSLTALGEGDLPTVSRTAYNLGVVGSYEAPQGTPQYSPGTITVSTVTGDAFVQVVEFIATDNVLILEPLVSMSPAVRMFMAAAINMQKWRYSYGRQCYVDKFKQLTIYVPHTQSGAVDFNFMAHTVGLHPLGPQATAPMRVTEPVAAAT